MKYRFPLLPNRTPNLELPPKQAATLRAAMGAKNPVDLCVVFSDNEVRLDDREALADYLRYVGCTDLARRIRTALVPQNQILVFTDSEKGTGLCVLDVDDLLGPPLESAPTKPACFAMEAS